MSISDSMLNVSLSNIKPSSYVSILQFNIISIILPTDQQGKFSRTQSAVSAGSPSESSRFDCSGVVKLFCKFFIVLSLLYNKKRTSAYRVAAPYTDAFCVFYYRVPIAVAPQRCRLPLPGSSILSCCHKYHIKEHCKESLNVLRVQIHLTKCKLFLTKCKLFF